MRILNIVDFCGIALIDEFCEGVLDGSVDLGKFIADDMAYVL